MFPIKFQEYFEKMYSCSGAYSYNWYNSYILLAWENKFRTSDYRIAVY